MWARLEAEVVILEAMIALPNMDEQIAVESAKIFAKQGLIFVWVPMTGVSVSGDGVDVNYANGDASEAGRFDRLIVAVVEAPELGLFSADSSHG